MNAVRGRIIKATRSVDPEWVDEPSDLEKAPETRDGRVDITVRRLNVTAVEGVHVGKVSR